ncbi:unnamed protein product [Rodentolepis nana]|uniref:Ovule protein n=1 Tax=Rodentolepis nana TaxID=102285 RepID=A0A0R3TQF5_RODNA|nr:unnamed protein product [Rodentolepis nana]
MHFQLVKMVQRKGTSLRFLFHQRTRNYPLHQHLLSLLHIQEGQLHFPLSPPPPPHHHHRSRRHQ